MQETKELEWGAGTWKKAVFHRPTVTTWFRWQELIAPETNGSDPAPMEHGHDEPPPSTKVQKFKPGSELAQFLENVMIPECVIGYTKADGTKLKPSEVSLSDLGVLRFGKLATAIVQFMNEADSEDAFRAEEPQAVASP